MATNSKIEWTNHTANLWWGCTKVHRGCDNCYAEAWASRFGEGLWGNDVPRRAIKSVWGNLQKWNETAKKAGEVHRVFVGSMMDIFEKPMPLTEGRTTEDLRQHFFAEVHKYPNLMFLLLTKRPSNIHKYIPDKWKKKQPVNVMYGASVVDRKSLKDVFRAFEKFHEKVQFRELRFFLSIEPLLEEIDLEKYIGRAEYPFPSWVIVGGESGPNKRPFNPDWARLIQSDCDLYFLPFFMKQIDKVQPIPEDLMVREFPPEFQLV